MTVCAIAHARKFWRHVHVLCSDNNVAALISMVKAAYKCVGFEPTWIAFFCV